MKEKIGFLNESKGTMSMRRLVAFIFSLTLIAAIILIFVFRISWSWPVTLVILGIPALIIMLCLFFTTWEDISKVVSFHKGKSEEKKASDIPESKPDPNEL